MGKQIQNQTRYADLYEAHFKTLCERYERLLQREDLELLAIHAGQIKRQFLDDMEYPFKVNPHFKAWCPLLDAPNSWLIIRAGRKPMLVFFAVDDFWTHTSSIDDAFWLPWFHVELIATPDAVDQHLPYDKRRCVYIGEHIEVAQALGIVDVNPEPVMSYLHYHRLFKTEYEQACIRDANHLAVQGHEAAEAAYFGGASEFGCLLAYMEATGQGPLDVPYGHIIGHNENAAILHYAQQSRQVFDPQSRRSMMIDAGADVLGYAADVSRSYAWQEGVYSDLVKAVDQLCTTLIEGISPGMTFADLHAQSSQGIATILRQFDLVRLDESDMLEQQIPAVFMPHGIGHMLGLQVHDQGGNLADERGLVVPPPAAFPTLKTTRKIEADQVFTVEPGIYFIEPLLHRLANSRAGRFVNWAAIDALRAYGGVRIEDNVIIHRDHNENLTREQGLR
ncbi:Xaa-Pro dipeptidase [Aliidiomarina sp. Khilg15.8]